MSQSEVLEEREKLSPCSESEHQSETSTKSDKKLSLYFWSRGKKSWMRIPFAILGVSFLEIVFFLAANSKLQKLLRFEPSKMHQLWRFLTYMLLHEDWIHLSLNVLMQVLFAYFLEIRHSRSRVIALYTLGGVTAVLGASCFHPNLVIGASGGVYALLISHLADVMMNFEDIKYKVYRCVCILFIVFFDVVYNVIHFYTKKDPVISWETHVIGGTSGLFLGFVLFKENERLAKTRKLSLFYLGLIFYIILLISLVVITIQIKKCTPANVIRTRYVYFC